MENNKERGQTDLTMDYVGIVLLLLYSGLGFSISKSTSEGIANSLKFLFNSELHSWGSFILVTIMHEVLYVIIILVYSLMFFLVGFFIRKYLCSDRVIRRIYLNLLLLFTLIVFILFGYNFKEAFYNVL